MDNSLSSTEGPAHVASQVLLARFLFREGERALEARRPMSSGLAVSLFQDAVELMIWAVAKALDTSLKDQAPFDSFWDAIPKASKNLDQLELPSRVSMRELNKARVNFKHYGQLPIAEDARRFHMATDAFLRETASRFLRVDIDAFSLADLVTNAALRDRIKQAESCFGKEQWQECVEACALAERLVANEFSTVIPEPDSNLSQLGRLIEDRSVGRHAEEGLRYLGKYLSLLRRLGIQGLVGGNLKHYLRFKAIAPSVMQFGDGRAQFVYGFGATKLAKSEAEFCIKYVIDFALQAQEGLAG